MIEQCFFEDIGRPSFFSDGIAPDVIENAGITITNLTATGGKS